jgi:hypothetical protein
MRKGFGNPGAFFIKMNPQENSKSELHYSVGFIPIMGFGFIQKSYPAYSTKSTLKTSEKHAFT